MEPPTAAALHEAVAQDDVELVRALLAQGVDANAQDAGSTPPLHRARVSAAVAELLLRHGARVNRVSDFFDEQSPLLHAVWRNDEALLRVLLAHGARADVPHLGRTPPLVAATGKGNVAMVAALLDAGAQMTSRDSSGVLAIHAALFGNKASGTCGDESLAVARLLLARGADVRARANTATPLHFAAKSGCTHAVPLLVAYGARLEARSTSSTSYGATPLLLAAHAGHVKVVAALLKAGADAHTTDAHGASALDLAARTFHGDVVLLLAQHSAPALALMPDAERYFKACFRAPPQDCEWLELQARSNASWSKPVGNLLRTAASGAPLSTADPRLVDTRLSAALLLLLLLLCALRWLRCWRTRGRGARARAAPRVVTAHGGLRTLAADTWDWLSDAVVAPTANRLRAFFVPAAAQRNARTDLPQPPPLEPQPQLRREAGGAATAGTRRRRRDGATSGSGVGIISLAAVAPVLEPAALPPAGIILLAPHALASMQQADEIGEQPPPPASPRPAPPLLPSPAMQQPQPAPAQSDAEVERECVICLDAPQQGAFLPCGHRVACLACGESELAAANATPARAPRCPCCRAVATHFARIYV